MSSPLRVPVESFFKSLTHEQRAALQLPSTGQVELSQVDASTWVLSLPNGQLQLGEKAAFTITPLHQKVLKLLQSHRMPDIVEGRFEHFLSAEELTAFTELKAAGRIICVKTNPKYDKGFYREAAWGRTSAPTPIAPTPKPAMAPPVSAKPMEEYTLVQDGFMVLRSDGAAKAASFDLAERIKAGEIKGIKSFDGFYYIIENAVLERHTPRLLKELQEKKKLGIDDLSSAAGVPVVLARIALEFAKEDGVVIEKQKNLYAYVG